MKIINFCKLLILLTAFLAGTGFAQSNKVLIVNSEKTVYRYETIATEFKKVLQQNAYQWIEFNLDRSCRCRCGFETAYPARKSGAYLLHRNTSVFVSAKCCPQQEIVIFSSYQLAKIGCGGDGTYGVANELSSAQEISLLRYFFPTIKTIGLLYNDSFSREYVESIKKDALALGINVINQVY